MLAHSKNVRGATPSEPKENEEHKQSDQSSIAEWAKMNWIKGGKVDDVSVPAVASVDTHGGYSAWRYFPKERNGKRKTLKEKEGESKNIGATPTKKEGTKTQ